MTTGIILNNDGKVIQSVKGIDRVGFEHPCSVALECTNSRIEYKGIKEVIFTRAQKLVKVTEHSSKKMTVKFEESIVETILSGEASVIVLTEAKQIVEPETFICYC